MASCLRHCSASVSRLSRHTCLYNFNRYRKSCPKSGESDSAPAGMNLSNLHFKAAPLVTGMNASGLRKYYFTTQIVQEGNLVSGIILTPPMNLGMKWHSDKCFSFQTQSNHKMHIEGEQTQNETTLLYLFKVIFG